MKTCLNILCFLLASQLALAQVDRGPEVLARELEGFAKEHKELNQKIDINASGSIAELVQAIIVETGVNLTIDPSVENKNLTFNFKKTPVKDILLYLCNQYKLDLKFFGSIITIVPYNAGPKSTYRPPNVDYNSYNQKISLDLKQDTLLAVLREISLKTGTNVIATREVGDTKVNGFIGKTTLPEALEQLAVQNGLGLQRNTEGYYIFGPKPPADAAATKNANKDKNALGDIVLPEGLNMLVHDSLGVKTISISASNVPLQDILKAVSFKMGKQYFIYDPSSAGKAGPRTPTVPGNTKTGSEQGIPISIQVEKLPYEAFLDKLFQGTNLTYILNNDIYLIGNREMEGLRITKVIQLQYRTVDKIEELIPEPLKQADMTIKVFPELNSIVVSGSALSIKELEAYINQIDKLVPVVNIEIIIMDVNKGRLIETGISAGIGTPPAASQTLFPAVDFTFSSGAINDLLGWLGGNGIVNLGPVRADFYMSLKAIEENNIVKIRSNPRLSTLNSHEASFTIGTTVNFLVEGAVVQGGNNVVTTQTRTAQSAEANFTVKVTPFVSGDEQITLKVDVDQSSFRGEARTNLPPDKVTRKFSSDIRVKNGDMIVLGGIEEDNVQESTRGLPLISRIPVLNWIFGAKKRNRSKSQLLVFIKPVVLY
jgi:type IV pilus assembly protein PilQ